MPARPLRLVLSVLLCSLLWGSAFPGIKYLYRLWPESTAWDTRLLLAGIRFMIAGLLLVPVAGIKGYVTRVRGAQRSALVQLTLGQTFGQYIFFYTGLAISSGVLGALLISAGSFWWVLLAPMLLGTPAPTRKHWLFLSIGALGIGIALYRPGLQQGNPVLGGFCFIIAALCGTLGIIAQTRMKPDLDTRTATSFSLGAGGLLLCLAGFPAWGEARGLLDPQVAGMTLYLAAVSATAFALWNRLARDYPVNLLAGYRFLIPLAGIGLSMLFIPDEKPGPALFLGGTLTLGSLIALNRLSKPSPTKPESDQATRNGMRP